MRSSFDAFKSVAVGLDYYLDPEKREQDAQEQYQRVCAIGHWMHFLGFPQYSLPEDDERLHLCRLLRPLVSNGR